MNLGGSDKKKVYWLGGLVAVAIGTYFYNSTSSDSPASGSTPQQAQTKPIPGIPDAAAPPLAARRRGNYGRSGGANLGQEFRPAFKETRPEKRPNLSTIDPTLRLDLLAKVQGVQIQGGVRDLFRFAAAPVEPVKLPKEPKIVVGGKGNPLMAGNNGTMTPPGPPPPPPVPPITFKYYGYSTQKGSDGRKRAFFLDGEDIIVAREGELINKRYRVVRIGVNSVVMEDTQFKNTQTLPLQEDAVS